jgi:hypothetical protein
MRGLFIILSLQIVPPPSRLPRCLNYAECARRARYDPNRKGTDRAALARRRGRKVLKVESRQDLDAMGQALQRTCLTDYLGGLC